MAEEDGVIAVHYRIEPGRQAFSLQGGLRAFAVSDRREPAAQLIAIETRPDLPVRPRIPLLRGGTPVSHAVLPVDYGAGRDPTGKAGFYVVGEAPPGNPVGFGPPWREGDLVACVIQPAAAALAALHARGLTHRAINPANLFRAGPRDLVTLGPFWAAPPASLQPAVFEPPTMARCLASGRGEGSIADDVYALGVTVLALAAGRIPLADLDEPTILRRKLELGSFGALAADIALPPLISDMLRGMLAEDPDHRPSPALLGRPEQARARRVAARPPRRAQVPLDIGGYRVWSARELAYGLGLRPERGTQMLKSGDVERWLRRALGDPQLGMRVEEITRRGDPGAPEDARLQGLMLMRSIAAIDPLAPLVWRGVAIQPDGLGPALAAATPEVVATLQEIIGAEAVVHYCAANYRRQETPMLREDQKDWRAWLGARGPAGGLKRLIYGMNALLPCGSPLLGGRPVVRLADLLPALDSAAAAADTSRPPIDAHIAAFIAARADSSLTGDLTTLTSFAEPADRLSILRLFGRLQARLEPGKLPYLARWLVTSGMAGLEDWRSRHTRAALQANLNAATDGGQISQIVELLDNEPARRADRQGAEQAAAQMRALEEALAAIETDAPRRAAAAHLLGHEVVTGAGLIASLGAAVALALQ